ncbi:MAG: hypothetical protein ACFFB9_02905 [Promethearchaeota archaeon]
MKRSNTKKSILFIVIFSMFFSYFLAIGYSNVVGIPEGFQLKQIMSLKQVPEPFPSTYTFTYTSSDLLHIENYLGGIIDDTGSWDVNTTTRIVSNTLNFGPSIGDHSVFWIYTDVALNDQIVMCNLWLDAHTGSGDTGFNITGEAMHGTMEVWILEDEFGSEVWYEKERGFMVNGTLQHSGDYNKYEFVSASVPSPPAVPGYNCVLIITVIAIVTIMIIKKQNAKK